MDIRLEQLEKKDFPVIRDWVDPQIFRIFKSPVDDQQLEKLLSKEKDGIYAEIGMRAADSKSNEIVGLIHSIVNVRDDFLHIQQLIVDPARRGNGYGPAILAMFLDYCFVDHSFHRAQLFTDENNKPAIACYKKVGFKVDGFLRDIVKTNSGYIGTYIFSILRDEWLAKRGNQSTD